MKRSLQIKIFGIILFCIIVLATLFQSTNKENYENQDQNQDNQIIFVTSFRDIGRGNFQELMRTNDNYYAYFEQLSKMSYNLIVYIDNKVKNDLLSKYQFNNNIIFEDLANVNTFYDVYNDNNTKIINSLEYKNRIPERRKNLLEHSKSEYNSTTNSKPNFLRHAKQSYPDYEFYAWIDFGGIRNPRDLPRNIDTSILPKKVIFHAFEIPLVRQDEYTILTLDDPYFDGSQFIVHTSLVDTFDELCDEKLQKWSKINVSDDDQSLFLQVYYDHPEMFHLVINDEFFSLCRSLII